MSDNIEHWEERKNAIALKLLTMIAEAPRDLIVQGKHFTVTMRSYTDGARFHDEGAFGSIQVSSDDEHFDFALTMDGWGTVRSIETDGDDEEEGDG